MKKNKNLNIPNILAFIRLLLAPVMYVLLVNQDAAIFEGIHPSWLNYLPLSSYWRVPQTFLMVISHVPSTRSLSWARSSIR